MERIIITRVLWLLLFSTTLIFGSSIKEIEGLYKKIPYASKAQTAQILHNLENLYISAVVSDDKKAIIKSLKAIVKCQKLLNINSKTYEQELIRITKISPKAQKPKIVTKPLKTYKPKYTPPKPKRLHTITKPKVINQTLNIRSIIQKQNTIIIKFDKPLTKSKMLFFEINHDQYYKDIYDLKANLRFRAPKLKLSSLKSAKIAQNKKGKVRLVLEDREKIYSNAYIRQGTLFITVQEKKKKEKIHPKPIQTIKHLKRQPTKKATYSSKAPTTNNTIYATSKLIVIDPGHGGKDSGAVGYKKYKEKNSVLKVAKLLKNILKKKGYKVALTRDNDKFIKLSNRTHFANKKEADLFISIHANAAPSAQKLSLKGIETFFLSPAKTAKAKRIAAKENSAVSTMNNMSKDTLLSFLNTTKIIQSNKLAIDIQKSVLTQVHKKYKDVKDGGVREAPFWVLVGAQMPAVLVEIGYITNPTEGDRIFNPFYQKSLAKGIANGVNNYFVHNR